MRSRIFIGLATLLISACTLTWFSSSAPGPVTGTVLNIVDGKPLADVYVVATASGHVSTFMSGYFTCYRTGLAITDNNGAFHMPDYFSKARNKEKIDSDWRSISLYLYKPHFQTARKTIDEDIQSHDQIATSLGQVRPKINWLRYMAPSNADREQRLRDLFALSMGATCEREGNATLLPLYKAVYSEAKELAVTNYDKYLLDKMRYQIGAQSNPPTPIHEPILPDNPIITATKSENPSRIISLLHTTSSEDFARMIDDRASDDLTALMYASSIGNDKVARELIDAGADPNKVTFSGETALCLAIGQYARTDERERNRKSAAWNTVNILVRSPHINLDQLCSDGRTPLIHSIRLPEIFRLLLESGADPNVEVLKGTFYRQRVLGSIVHEMLGSSEYVGKPLPEALVKSKKLNLDAVVFEGTTALELVASLGRPDILKLVLEAGANPNASSAPGTTPLGRAIRAAIANPSREQCVEAVKVLLDSDVVDVDAIAYDGKSAIELVKKASRLDLVKLLESKSHGRAN